MWVFCCVRANFFHLFCVFRFFYTIVMVVFSLSASKSVMSGFDCKNCFALLNYLCVNQYVDESCLDVRLLLGTISFSEFWLDVFICLHVFGTDIVIEKIVVLLLQVEMILFFEMFRLIIVVAGILFVERVSYRYGE